MYPRKWMTLPLALTILAALAVGCGNPSPAETSPTNTPHQPTPQPSNPYTPTYGQTYTSDGVPLIYDDDGSRDGLAALFYLLSIPDYAIEAVNISYGEAHPELYIQHMGRSLDAVGIQGIPLGAGQDAPLGANVPFPDWLRQLSDAFWDYPVPYPERTYPARNAPELMVSTIQQSPEPVTIFLSGTFTNLAQALRIDPGIRYNIAAVYIMGGAVYGPGNITNLLPDSGNAVAE